MKTIFSISLLALALLMPACTYQQSGALNKELFEATMQSKRIAVTPSQPGWLLEKPQVHTLSAADLETVRGLLRKGTMRSIPDAYYYSVADGNRGDTTVNTFYLYGSNMQCLGARVINDRVMMDDLELDEATEKELYRVLRPYLAKLYKGLPK